jgi:hypothetical protein
MGWSSWNAFGTDIDEDEILDPLERWSTFIVYGDGKVLATSRPLKWGESGQRISVDVSGVKIIELVARAATNDPATLPVTWAEAALLVGSKDHAFASSQANDDTLAGISHLFGGARELESAGTSRSH